MFKKINFIAIILALFTAVPIFAQEGFESAASSNLTNISLPANALRMSPEAVPAEITQTLDKFVEAGEGKFQKGNSEVLAWNGGKITTVNRLIETVKTAGWKYEVGDVENGITVFSLLKDGKQRRAIMGFYGESDGILVLAWVEVLANEKQSENTERAENIEAVSGDNNEIAGIWRKGGISMLQDRNTVTGATTAANGTNLKFVFHPNGRFEFVGYLQSTMYGCTTDLFNDKQGKYEIKGTKITLIPNKNYWKNTYSCSPKSNKERNYTLESETYELKFKTDEYGKSNVCLTNAKGETCYRKEKE